MLANVDSGFGVQILTLVFCTTNIRRSKILGRTENQLENLQLAPSQFVRISDNSDSVDFPLWIKIDKNITVDDG